MTAFGVRRGVRVAGCVGLGVALGLAGCSRAAGDAQEADGVGAGGGSAGVRVVNVEVMPVRPGDFTGTIRATGQVEAYHDVTVGAEETGRVAAFVVPKGTRVAAGDVVARLDPTLLEAQVAEARAEAALAREQFERQRQLWEEERMGTEIAYVRAKYEAERAAARLAQLEERLARTEIMAPVAGVFDEKFVEEGEMVSAGAPVARIVATDRVKIAAGIPERYASSVEPGDSGRVWFDVLPGREFTGAISFVGTSVDRASRTFPIEIVMANPGRVVKPHMVANVEVRHERLRGVVVVPRDVVQRSADGYKVFVAAERDGVPVAEARTVTLGPSAANRTVITDGLEEGDRLITLGHRQLDEGIRIRIVNENAGPGREGG